jgi:hypothetical protein
VVDELKAHDFEIISTNLPEEQEQKLREAFAHEGQQEPVAPWVGSACPTAQAGTAAQQITAQGERASFKHS